MLHSAAARMADFADALEAGGGDALNPKPSEGPGDTASAAAVSVRAPILRPASLSGCRSRTALASITRCCQCCQGLGCSPSVGLTWAERLWVIEP